MADASPRRDPDPAQMDEAVRKEVTEAWSAAPAGAAMTPAQTRGGIAGGVVGAIIGGAIGALIGLLPLFDLNVGLRILIVGIIAAVAGSLVGALLGGFFSPDGAGETGSLPGEGPRSKGRRRSGHAA